MSDEKVMKIEEPIVTLMKDTALSLVREGNEWYVVEIPFNATAGITGEIKKIAVGPGRDYAIEKFKIRTIELELFTKQ